MVAIVITNAGFLAFEILEDFNDFFFVYYVGSSPQAGFH